jgi:hypothetical protein
VNATQIDRLTRALPANADDRHRRRVYGYAATARRCEDRIAALRTELERVQRAVDDAVAVDTGEDAPADEALRVVCELDALERAQPRIDAWLRVAAGALSTQPDVEPFGEGPC